MKKNSLSPDRVYIDRETGDKVGLASIAKDRQAVVVIRGPGDYKPMSTALFWGLYREEEGAE